MLKSSARPCEPYNSPVSLNVLLRGSPNPIVIWMAHSSIAHYAGDRFEGSGEWFHRFSHPLVGVALTEGKQKRYRDGQAAHEPLRYP